MRKAAGLCTKCGKPATGRTLCDYHAEKAAAQQRAREVEHRRRLAARREAGTEPDTAYGRVPGFGREPLPGSNPTKCGTLGHPYDAEQEQRVNCVRRLSCLDIAAKRGWRGWNCGACAFTEEAVEPLRLRCGGDQSQPWPQVSGAGVG